MKSTLVGLLPILTLCCVSARADTVTYTDSGAFSAVTPSDALGFSGPDETWSFSFEADANPAVSDVGMGGFSFAFSDFSYTLDGSLVSIAPTFIRFFSAGNGGGFLICFNGDDAADCTDGLGTGFPADDTQLYSGTTSAPTLTPGSFDLAAFGVVVNGTSNFYALPDTTLQASSSPEPSTLLMFAAGFLVLGPRCWRSSGKLA